jgi:hypothetical protein
MNLPTSLKPPGSQGSSRALWSGRPRPAAPSPPEPWDASALFRTLRLVLGECVLITSILLDVILCSP